MRCRSLLIPCLLPLALANGARAQVVERPTSTPDVAQCIPTVAAAANSPASSALPVSYFEKERVAASFARGAVLFDGEGGRNYEIHTSRRSAAGMAEIHARDTDVIYVTGGSATLVTGGTVVDGRNTADNEIRGTSIRGGETRSLAPGDVVIVPAGVPHWFQQVSAPFTYYVVKVR